MDSIGNLIKYIDSKNINSSEPIIAQKNNTHYSEPSDPKFSKKR